MKTIKKYREARGIKQVDLAAQFGVAQSTVVKWESEGGYPPSRILDALAAYLGCTVNDLYADKPSQAAV